MTYNCTVQHALLYIESYWYAITSFMLISQGKGNESNATIYSIWSISAQLAALFALITSAYLML